MDIYKQLIIEHYKNPLHFGRLDRKTVSGSSENPSCGDNIVIDLQIGDGSIVNVGFDGSGCAISQAGASLLCDFIKNKSLDDVRAIDREQVLSLLGVDLTESRKKCALTAFYALQNAIYNLK